MPDADTVWLTPLPELVAALEGVGLVVRWSEECSRAHLEVVDSMLRALTEDRQAIAERVGTRAVDDLLGAHTLWREWLASGRVRKFAVVAEKTG